MIVHPLLPLIIAEGSEPRYTSFQSLLEDGECRDRVDGTGGSEFLEGPVLNDDTILRRDVFTKVDVCHATGTAATVGVTCIDCEIRQCHGRTSSFVRNVKTYQAD